MSMPSHMHVATQHAAEPALWIIVVLQTSFFAFKLFSSMLFGLVYVYSIEVYPTVARATGTGICITMGRVGAITSPLIYEWLSEGTGHFIAFFGVLVGICLVDVVLVLMLPYETKGCMLKDYADEIEPVLDTQKP